MNLVIDANIIKGYYMETVLEIDPGLTGSVIPIMEPTGKTDYIFLDSNGIIEHEWENPVDPEWFSPWFAKLLNDECAFIIEVDMCNELRKKLKRLYFPVYSRDIWYIRTAKSILKNERALRYMPDGSNYCFIISEDIHFYDPRKKGTNAEQRHKIIISCQGPVSDFLSDEEGILVSCVYNYVDNVIS